MKAAEEAEEDRLGVAADHRVGNEQRQPGPDAAAPPADDGRDASGAAVSTPSAGLHLQPRGGEALKEWFDLSKIPSTAPACLERFLAGEAIEQIASTGRARPIKVPLRPLSFASSPASFIKAILTVHAGSASREAADAAVHNARLFIRSASMTQEATVTSYIVETAACGAAAAASRLDWDTLFRQAGFSSRDVLSSVVEVLEDPGVGSVQDAHRRLHGRAVVTFAQIKVRGRDGLPIDIAISAV